MHFYWVTVYIYDTSDLGQLVNNTCLLSGLHKHSRTVKTKQNKTKQNKTKKKKKKKIKV